MLQNINQIFEIEKKSNDQSISIFERNFKEYTTNSKKWDIL